MIIQEPNPPQDVLDALSKVQDYFCTGHFGNLWAYGGISSRASYDELQKTRQEFSERDADRLSFLEDYMKYNRMTYNRRVDMDGFKQWWSFWLPSEGITTRSTLRQAIDDLMAEMNPIQEPQ